MAEHVEANHPRIAVIIMAHGLRPSLADAVRSLQSQSELAELVLVHSGEGDAEKALHCAGLHTRVIHSDTRRLPGGARNVGIAATRAPIIAFLADDCLAEPNWLTERLRAHDEGASAVASALLCHRPRNPVALAAHLSLYVRRLPRATPEVALAYGASYKRALFDHHGLFREDMESGEDTEFHERLSASDKPLWRPQVRTTHIGAETFGAFIASQVNRGRRMAAAWAALGSHNSAVVARDALKRTARIIRESWQFIEPEQRLATLFAIPLIALGNIAYAWGAWTWSYKRDLGAP